MGEVGSERVGEAGEGIQSTYLTTDPNPRSALKNLAVCLSFKEGYEMERLESVAELDFTPQDDIFLSPRDWRDVFVYFLLVDRFDNNKEDLPAYDSVATPKGRCPSQGRVFQGGNLKGVTRRLDYIQGLGANAIWLSPVFKNRQEKNDAYHGYGIQDFLDVDPRFGTKADLQELVRQAHEKGMYVILDIIINHTGDNWGYEGGPKTYSGETYEFGFWREVDLARGFQKNDAVWPRELQNPDCYKRKGKIDNWEDRDQAIHGDFHSLKELDITQSIVLDTLIKAYKYWISITDVDGFRVDTVKHMESSATAIFCNAVREYAKHIGKDDFFIFGEVAAGDDELIHEYIGRNSRISGTSERFPSLDAALDFPLYHVLEDVIKGFRNPWYLRDRYERFRTLYSDHGEAGRYFVTFVDNHDRNQRFLHNNPFTRQMVLAMGYLLTSQGVPCIYYGSEQGFDGGGDYDGYVRECMFGGQWGAFDSKGHHFFNQDNPVYQSIREIAAVRQSEPALRYGRQYFREISGNGIDFGHPVDGNCTLAYSRILDTTEVLVAMNLDNDPRSDFVTVDANLSPVNGSLADLLGSDKRVTVEQCGSRHAVRIPLEGHEMVILKSC